jgi:energy-coupling factor transporter transmembrane protein EcfT
VFSGSSVTFSLPVWLLVIAAFALLCGAIARYNGRSFWSWFGWGILFGPLTLIYFLLFESRKGQGGH